MTHTFVIYSCHIQGTPAGYDSKSNASGSDDSGSQGPSSCEFSDDKVNKDIGYDGNEDGNEENVYEPDNEDNTGEKQVATVGKNDANVEGHSEVIPHEEEQETSVEIS